MEWQCLGKRGGDIDGEAANDKSGQSVSLSADGNIVAIGASNYGKNTVQAMCASTNGMAFLGATRQRY